MRILVLSDLWLPFPGGAERMIYNITQALHERGHDIHILTSYAKAKSTLPMTIKDIGVYECQIEGAQLILDFINQDPPDVILTHHFFCGAFSELLGEFAHGLHREADRAIPFIEIIHNRPRHPDAAFAIFNSEFTAARCGRREDDMVMLPPATNECVACFKFDCRLRGPHGHGGGPGLEWKRSPHDCIGHIKPLGGKGIALTYRLAEAMPERRFLVLRGEWQDGEDIRHLPNVEFMEPVDDIREFYSRVRLMLMPSLSEDAGTIGQESALNGIPCISNDVGGLPETNKGGLVLPSDIFSWSRAIKDFDDADYYQYIVNRQRTYITSLNFPARFDEIDRKVRALCAT